MLPSGNDNNLKHSAQNCLIVSIRLNLPADGWMDGWMVESRLGKREQS